MRKVLSSTSDQQRSQGSGRSHRVALLGVGESVVFLGSCQALKVGKAADTLPQLLSYS